MSHNTAQTATKPSAIKALPTKVRHDKYSHCLLYACECMKEYRHAATAHRFKKAADSA
jgi:hypothetical protein